MLGRAPIRHRRCSRLAGEQAFCVSINDMDSTSAAALARQLGTSAPRVARAIERLGIDCRGPNGRFAISPSQRERLRHALGVTPRADGLTRPETVALAALRSAPFGLVSARAVSRRSGLSPTAAARALKSLRAKDLAVLTSETVAAGRVRQVGVWRAGVANPRWPELDPVLDRVVAPARPKSADSRVPRRLRHLFWNAAESQLSVMTAGPYIARRLLRTMDIQGLAWGAGALRPDDWRQASKARGLDPKARKLARNLAQSPPELRQLAEPTRVAGLAVAGLQDLMAMKIKVLAERGEMRDYFDVKVIDEHGAVSVEEGVDLYMERYGVSPSSESLPHLYRAMGDLSDVEVDDLLPVGLAELQRWWSRRQVEVLRNSDRFG